ncbi:SRPBCC domain-containing protein [Candidatus Woesearchaeota archaeon]|nr:SRPBCC domain-containing protein [Candidatus Woesearchaeota archaeon]
MADIRVDAIINVSPERVYEALTKKDHIEKWWTKDCSIDSKEGGEARFEFNPYGDYVIVQIKKLNPDLVEWKIIDSKMMGTGDWVDTNIKFEIKKDDGKTELNFLHENFKEETECYKVCIDGWNHFINSLKLYLETGKGTPFEG